jgi:flagellar biogenesis protein FliO
MKFFVQVQACLLVFFGVCINLHAQTTSNSPAAIPFKQEAGSGSQNLSNAGLGVILVSLAVIVVVLFIRKKLHFSTKNIKVETSLRIVDSQRLGPKTILSVVEFSDTQYLLAQTEHGVTCIASAIKKPFDEMPK